MVVSSKAIRSVRFFAVALLLASFALAGLLLSRVHESTRPNAQDARRIVSMAPSLTELLFAVGAGEQVVGVSSYTQYPAEAAGLPVLGGQLDPDLEALAGLRPDLILTLGHHPRIATHGQELDVEVMEIPMDTLEQVFEAVSIAGEATGHLDEAAALRVTLKAELDRLASEAERHRGGREKPKVLLVVGREPGRVRGVFAAGRGSYLGDALELAGARNAVAGTRPWPELSAEEIVRFDPDVIIELQADELPNTPALWKSTFPTVAACRHNAVETLVGRGLLIPGPRVNELVRQLAHVVGRY